MYNTNLLNNNEDKDCLYQEEMNEKTNELSLIPYCKRHDYQQSINNINICHSNQKYTFEELRLRKITGDQLFQWKAPIDIINDYEKYLITNDRSLFHHYFCNCSLYLWVGSYCQYLLDDYDCEHLLSDDYYNCISNFASPVYETFNQIVQFQYSWRLTSYFDEKIFNDLLIISCYQGLQCHSTICLDWRQICDGILDCEQGEDEPKECLLLEMNQCENDQYRCKFGMCIDKIFLLDFSYDCMDLSDEKHMEYSSFFRDDCEIQPSFCDNRLCPSHAVSCGDGVCYQCGNFRNLLRRKSLLLSSSLLYNHHNIDCWLLLSCFNEYEWKILIFLQNDPNPCEKFGEMDFKHFQKYCPLVFEFQSKDSYLYPFVRYLYYRQDNKSSDYWYLPTHLCYNESFCPNLPPMNGLLINGLRCIERREVRITRYGFSYAQKLFSRCHYPKNNSETLYYCEQSRKYISKYRVNDGIFDCFFHEDEDEGKNLTRMRLLNLTNLFKCVTTDQWFSRTIIGKGICDDDSDTWFIGHCKIASDIGCQFLRGLSTISAFYTFTENCNGNLKMTIPYENQTDESDCEQWPKYRLCDDYWDTDNGEDELNCPNKIFFYIKRVVFKCQIDEHYCAYKNGTIGCLAKERAGDKHFDCLGGTDERRLLSSKCQLYQQPFQCLNSYKCIPLKNVCNTRIDCSDSSDELICPWLSKNNDEYASFFFCKNGTKIYRSYQCDNIIHCQPDGEDEWFCDLSNQKSYQIDLNNINEYPITIDKPVDIKISNRIPSLLLSSTRNSRSSIRNYSGSYQYCNRGILIWNQSLGRECLCSPNFYGLRCEFQSERLLTTVRIDIPVTLSRYRHEQSAIRLVACLMFNQTIVYHEQTIHIQAMKQMFYLNYPRPPPRKRGDWAFRLDAYVVNKFEVEFRSAWYFDVPFSFLPVNRLVLHLLLDDSMTCNTLHCIHGICKKYLNSPYHSYCHCENNWRGYHCDIPIICSCGRNGKCLDRSLTSICVCPLGQIGRECYGLIETCNNIECLHGGTCIPSDERLYSLFICLCPRGYFGRFCEDKEAQIIIRFSQIISSQYNSKSIVILIHFLELSVDSPGVLSVRGRDLYQQSSWYKGLYIFDRKHKYLSNFIVLQIFSQSNQIDYYIAGIIKQHRKNLTTIIDNSYRCPNINELINNKTMEKFSPLKKVKFYHPICYLHKNINCFYDETYLCFCDIYRQLDCLVFPRSSTQCSINYCQNNAQCIKIQFNSTWDFRCVCQECSFGSLCQLKISDYALSLSSMLGQDILEDLSIIDQPLLIKMSLTILILMFLLGILSNILSYVTLKQPKIQEYGCGHYLFYLPFIGQFGLSILIGRYSYLLGTQIYQVTHRSVAHWTCIILEYFLSVCPMLFDWLTACVAVERCCNILQGVSFDKKKSVWWAKRIICLVILIVLLSSWHEIFSYQLIDDPRALTQHTWCVVNYTWSWLKYYRITINLINLFLPNIINLIATGFLLYKSTYMKYNCKKDQKKNEFFRIFRKQFLRYGSQFVLIILGMLRLIFSFTLICIIHQWQKYIYLIAYFISFIPLMGTFPIFVLPAKIYRDEFKKCFSQLTKNKFRILCWK